MLDLIFKDQKFGAISNITIDAVVAEEHIQGAVVTEYAVEEGSNISDHVRSDAETVTITGYISNQPIIDVWNYNPFLGESGLLKKVGASFGVPGDLVPSGDKSDETADGASIIPFIPGVAYTIPSLAISDAPEDVIASLSTATTFMFDKEFDRARNAFEALIEIVQDGRTVDIATSLKEYKSMIIESFSVTRDVVTSDSLYFTATAKKIKIVESSVTRMQTPKIPAAVGLKEAKTSTKPANTGDATAVRNKGSDSSALGNAGIRRK